jgi:1,4-dihydroxy-2-naphthoyl-CoA hydrolase
MSGPVRKTAGPKQDVFANHPIAQLLGIRLKSITRKRVSAELPVVAGHMNRGGRVAGGVIMTFADLLGARGTVANLPPGARTTTLESKTNFFAAGEGPLLKAVSVPLHIGRTTMVWQTTVRNADGRLVAVVTQTQIVLPQRATQATQTEAPAPEGKAPAFSGAPIEANRARKARKSAPASSRVRAKKAPERVNRARVRAQRP